LCAEIFGDVTESAVYVATTSSYTGFWVASCAQDLCKYFGDYSYGIHMINDDSRSTVPLEAFFTKKDILEKEYASHSK